jgi:hypothetical protein
LCISTYPRYWVLIDLWSRAKGSHVTIQYNEYNFPFCSKGQASLLSFQKTEFHNFRDPLLKSVCSQLQSTFERPPGNVGDKNIHCQDAEALSYCSVRNTFFYVGPRTLVLLCRIHETSVNMLTYCTRGKNLRKFTVSRLANWCYFFYYSRLIQCILILWNFSFLKNNEVSF